MPDTLPDMLTMTMGEGFIKNQLNDTKLQTIVTYFMTD